MDTVWQHARCTANIDERNAFYTGILTTCGRRPFVRIHQTEEDLRELRRLEASGESVPIRLLLRVRGYASKTLPNQPFCKLSGVVTATLSFISEKTQLQLRKFSKMLQGAFVPIARGVGRADRAVAVALDLVFELVNLVPIRDDESGRWNPDVISAIIESYREQFQGQCRVCSRDHRRRISRLRDGREVALVGRRSPSFVIRLREFLP